MIEALGLLKAIKIPQPYVRLSVCLSLRLSVCFNCLYITISRYATCVIAITADFH